MIVVHSCAAATSARDAIVPVHRLPIFLGGTPESEVMLTGVATATAMHARDTARQSRSMLRILGLGTVHRNHERAVFL